MRFLLRHHLLQRYKDPRSNSPRLGAAARYVSGGRRRRNFPSLPRGSFGNLTRLFSPSVEQPCLSSTSENPSWATLGIRTPSLPKAVHMVDAGTAASAGSCLPPSCKREMEQPPLPRPHRSAPVPERGQWAENWDVNARISSDHDRPSHTFPR